MPRDEYIKKAEVIELVKYVPIASSDAVQEEDIEVWIDGTEDAQEAIYRAVLNMSAADVVECKRGEWVEVSYWKYKNGHSTRYTAKRCSVCGADVGKKTQYNGCPYCFADMRM